MACNSRSTELSVNNGHLKKEANISSAFHTILFPEVGSWGMQ